VAGSVAVLLMLFILAFAVTALAFERKRIVKPGEAHGVSALVSELEVQRYGKSCDQGGSADSGGGGGCNEGLGKEGRAGTKLLRECIASMPVSAFADLDRDLRTPSPSKSLSSQQLVRLQACVSGPASGGPLRAPLSGQDCVMFAALASRREPRGPSLLPSAAAVAIMPVVSACKHLDFYVTLQGSESDEQRTRVKVSGEDVMLFDMFWGKFSCVRNLSSAPQPLQMFIGAEYQVPLIGGGGDAAAGGGEGNDELFEFEERALLLGTKVTLVGELVRRAGGELTLQPLGQGAPVSALSRALSAAAATAAASAAKSSATADAPTAARAYGRLVGCDGSTSEAAYRLLPWRRGRVASSIQEEEQRRAESDMHAAAQEQARSILISDDPTLLTAAM